MAQILKGAPVVAAMNEANAARCAALKEKGIVPTLAVVRVGAREDDISYEKGIVTRCGKVGVEVRQFHLAEDVTQEELLDVIRQINGDASVHGCLIFRPLPKRFDDRRVQEALAPEKDVDGITDGSMAGVFTNMPIGYPPCTAQACLEILKYYNVPLSGKRAVVVGRSLVVGKPAAMMLDRENATVTLAYDIDAEKMGRVLNTSREKMSDKAVKSAVKRVDPMRSQTGMSREDVVERLLDAARRVTM